MRRIPRVAILIETSRAYGRGLLEGVTQYVRDHGPWSISFKPQGLGEPPPAWLKSWQGDGILARIDDLTMARAVRRPRVPVLDLRGRLPDIGLPRVGVANHVLAKMAFQHLRERGLKQFAFCGVPEGEHVHMDQRCTDFTTLVEHDGLKCAVYKARPGRHSWEQEKQQLVNWLRGLPKPVGIMASHDDRGQELLDACLRAEVKVPDEAAVISVENDTILCNLANPPLTSIDVNPQRIGFEAAALLDRLLAGQPPPAQGIFLDQCRVVTRQSTDVLALDDPELVKALRFIRAHATSGVNVSQVLDQVCLSRSVLERRFKQVLGTTPKAEILAVQIERAKELLAETDLPLDAVARASGFHGDKYFGDIFFRKVGVRAGAYRRQTRRPSF